MLEPLLFKTFRKEVRKASARSCHMSRLFCFIFPFSVKQTHSGRVSADARISVNQSEHEWKVRCWEVSIEGEHRQWQWSGRCVEPNRYCGSTERMGKDEEDKPEQFLPVLPSCGLIFLQLLHTVCTLCSFHEYSFPKVTCPLCFSAN